MQNIVGGHMPEKAKDFGNNKEQKMRTKKTRKGIAYAVKIDNHGGGSTASDDPFDLLVPFVGFLVLGPCRDESKVSRAKWCFLGFG
jgi:hypothetical protein